MNVANKQVNIDEQFNLQSEQIIWHPNKLIQISYMQTNNFTWTMNALHRKEKYFYKYIYMC
jgi:hypothetical protein